MTVVIPTLTADSRLQECIASLAKQTFRDFEIVIVDNSGKGLVRASGVLGTRVRVIEMASNAGFAAAVNAGIRRSRAPFIVTLNDDTVAHPEWLAALVRTIRAHSGAGMCASQVRLFGEDRLDSAAMLICGDGSSKQRGHLRHPGIFADPQEALLPSASAALYRRAMLDEIGLFDEDFFLYCEDTDLGLRARWAGWTCRYVPDAIVEHHYSHTAGRVSSLKAYHVERNRLFVIAKNFPARMLAAAPFLTVTRYFWHVLYLLKGQGSAARFRGEQGSGWRMAAFVFRAHFSLLASLPSLWRKRRRIQRTARLSSAEFSRILKTWSIGPRQVAQF